jgi:hypothetical protein
VDKYDGHSKASEITIYFFDVMKFSSIQFIKIAFPLFENRLPITGTNMNRQILNK